MANNGAQRSMIEKAAKAMHAKLFATITDWRDELVPWDDLPQAVRNEFLYVARTVFEAIREPGEAMIAAGANMLDCEDAEGCARGVWWAMCDEITRGE